MSMKASNEHSLFLTFSRFVVDRENADAVRGEGAAGDEGALKLQIIALLNGRIVRYVC